MVYFNFKDDINTKTIKPKTSKIDFSKSRGVTMFSTGSGFSLLGPNSIRVEIK